MKRILIVDDDPQFGILAKLTLEETGMFEVKVQNESNDALAVARSFLPDLILLDIVMPGLDGGDVQALLKNDPLLHDVPVLIVSAIVSGEDADDDGIVYSGGDTLLPKTVNPKVLIEKIEQKLGEVV
ncbi:MAG: response regulator [Verrucomicrobiae bacterium]|nr:response regulator [Verrucomicrobiae bacterium]